jgi:DNA-binding MarR family transcriptional regulator
MKRPSLLQSEIRQRRPFQSVGEEAVLSLLRTTDLVRRRMADVIEPVGVTTQQYNVLRILRGAGADGIPTLEVAERMIEQAPGITRLMDRLEAKGLVRRQRCPRDRRQHLCWITSEGLALIKPLDASALAAIDTVLGGLARKDRATLVRLLDAIRGG